MSNTIIHLEGDIDVTLARDTKEMLQLVKWQGNPTLHIRINSYGGNLYAFNVICNLLMVMNKKRYRGCPVIGEAIHVESAALLLFLMFPKRYITTESTGVIHLPVFVKGRETSLKDIENERMIVINIIKDRTGMSEEQIRSLDGKLLNADQMIALNIATEKVPNFMSVSKS